MDLLRGQGRPERRRHRSVLQRHGPGADAVAARLPAPAGGRRDHRVASAAGADPRGRPTDRRRRPDRRHRRDRHDRHGCCPRRQRRHGRPGRRRPRDAGPAVTARKASGTDIAAREWKGPWRRYDIVKEGVIAVVIVSILTVLLAGLFSSPDEPQLAFQGWATSAADNFYATAVQELAGTSESAGYGPPYNTAADGITVGPLAPQEWFGVTHPVDAANDFVITPLRTQVQSADVK